MRGNMPVRRLIGRGIRLPVLPQGVKDIAKGRYLILLLLIRSAQLEIHGFSMGGAY